MRSTVSAWIVLTTGLKRDIIDYATLWMRFKMNYITEDCSSEFIQWLEKNYPNIIEEWENQE